MHETHKNHNYKEWMELHKNEDMLKALTFPAIKSLLFQRLTLQLIPLLSYAGRTNTHPFTRLWTN